MTNDTEAAMRAVGQIATRWAGNFSARMTEFAREANERLADSRKERRP